MVVLQWGLSAHGWIFQPDDGWAVVRGEDVFYRLQGIHPGRERQPLPSSAPATQALPRHGADNQRSPKGWPTLPGHWEHGLGRTFTSLHVPMFIYLTSNVPGHERPYNFISEGCPQRLVDNMLAYLWQISDAAYGYHGSLPVPAWQPGLSLWQRDWLYMGPWGLWGCWDWAGPHACHGLGISGLAKVRWVLQSWMISMPVVSFSGGHYDLQLIKPYLAHNYDAQEPPWLRSFRAYQGPQLALPSIAGDGDGDNHGNKIVSIL